jgi:hypothetical protein
MQRLHTQSWLSYQAVFLSGLLLAPFSLSAEPAPLPTFPPTTSAGAPPATSQESVTQTFGAIPEELAGLWLMVTNAKLSQGKVRNNFQLYRIRHLGNRWTFQRAEKSSDVPSLAPFVDAEKQTQPFRPSKQQIAKVRSDHRRLAALPLHPEASTFQVVHIRTAEEIPADPPPPPAAAGAKLAIEFLERLPTNGALSAVSFYVKKFSRDELEGHIHALTLVGLASAVTQGEFFMYRIE